MNMHDLLMHAHSGQNELLLASAAQGLSVKGF